MPMLQVPPAGDVRFEIGGVQGDNGMYPVTTHNDICMSVNLLLKEEDQPWFESPVIAGH